MVASGIFRKNMKRKTTDPVLSQSNLQANTNIHVRVLSRRLLIAKGGRHLRKGSMAGRRVRVQGTTTVLGFLSIPNQDINIQITLKLGKPVRPSEANSKPPHKAAFITQGTEDIHSTGGKFMLKNVSCPKIKITMAVDNTNKFPSEEPTSERI